MARRPRPLRPGWAAALALLALAGAARGQDPENCLSCHRFRGLSRLDPQTGELRLFFCNASYYAQRQGAHARLRCTACHERSEVEVIPHAVRTPVDCTRACHIAPATGTELRFSHRLVSDSLLHSSHSAARLAELQFAEPLLRPGQSECLYCHDEPSFGTQHGVPEGFVDHRGGTRCDTCHTQELPLEITYFANHVAARMKPARPLRQLAQVCAVCHSDAQLREQVGGHDAVASYLHSFHGKAALLGSTETATCVDCHSSHTGDQHLILAREDPESSVHPEQLPDTCRTSACHPGSPPEMSQAAVHLELDPAKFPLEFYVAAFFVTLTAAVMAVFFLLIILELINAVVRPADPGHHRLVRLARLLQDHPEGRALVQRMTVHQRVQHWGLVVTFAALVLTGMPIKFADAGWAEWLVRLLGGLTVARWIHRIAGIGLIAVFVYHLAYLLGKLLAVRRTQRRAGRPKPVWKIVYESPLVLRPRDLLEALQHVGYLLGLRRARPHFGRFNYTQKFEYWAVFWGVPIMGLSGLVLWGMPVVSEWLSGRAINFAFIIHSDEAYLAFIYIATVHLFGVIFAPVVFPLSLGTLTGQAPALELAEAHRGELEAIAQRLGVILPEHAPHHSRADAVRAWAGSLARRTYSLALTGGYALLAVVTLRYIVLSLTAHQAAPVEIVAIPRRLDAQQFFTTASLAPADAGPESRPRGPLAHFHQIPQWFQPDPGNTCATAGCHAPLPHGDRIEVRAFLNMHATFVDCMVCHSQTPQEPRGWIALPQRAATEPPAILQLATVLGELGTETAPADPAALNARLLQLIDAALPAANQNAQLRDWRVRLATTHPRSRAWRLIIDELQRDISLHVHGEYGAKIALLAGGQPADTPSDDARRAAREFLDQRPPADTPAGQALLNRVHAGVAAVGAMCTPCHSPQPPLVDLAKLGYPPARVAQVEGHPIMRSVLSIEQGQPFYLPLEDQPRE